MDFHVLLYQAEKWHGDESSAPLLINWNALAYLTSWPDEWHSSVDI